MIKRSYTITLEYEFDDEDYEAADKLDTLYTNGNMAKCATTAALHRVSLDGAQGARAIAARAYPNEDMRGKHIDHKDRNPGNNQRKNLAIVSRSDNMMNRSAISDKPSQYMYVSWVEKRQYWQGSLYLGKYPNGKTHKKTVAWSKCEITAAKAADKYIIDNKLDKPLNFPNGTAIVPYVRPEIVAYT